MEIEDIAFMWKDTGSNVIRYNEDGSILSKILTDDPGTIARHCALRDLAVRYATTAGAILAALPEDTSCDRLENG